MRRANALGERLGGVFRAAKSYYAVVPLAVPLLLASISVQKPADPSLLRPIDLGPEIRYELADASSAPLPAHATYLTIRSGDTLEALLRTGGMSADDSRLLTTQLSTSVDPKRLRPGNVFRFVKDTKGTVDRVQLEVTGWGTIDAARNGEGFSVTSMALPQKTVTVAAGAPITSSLYEAVCGTGENAQLVPLLVDVFQWDVDFFRLKKGDHFSLVVEKKFVGDEFAGYGAVLAARFFHAGEMYEAFRFQNADGTSGYYASSGAPLRKQFLKSPLKFTRITSGFTNRRFHPVLKRFKAHNGIDYGAPVGTPVMSTADGVIVTAGFDSGEGNYVAIRHNSQIQTRYLHLSRFASGLKRGQKVQQGDVIAYVGTTGLSTGPHLDYRVSNGGVWMNPLQLKSITPDPLRGDQLRRFKQSVASHLPRMTQSVQVADVRTRVKRALF